ncbi:hypothetical protein BH10ACT7_BH10ACT7_03160 [soil metagenome]
MGTIVLVAVAFLILLWILIAVRRRALRTYLLTTGVETSGTAALVWPKGKRRAPAIAVTYVDSEGVTRTAIKSIVSSGDSELMKKAVRVVFHPRRTTRDDYVLLGFGDHPGTWFRVSFAKT